MLRTFGDILQTLRQTDGRAHTDRLENITSLAELIIVQVERTNTGHCVLIYNVYEIFVLQLVYEQSVISVTVTDLERSRSSEHTDTSHLRSRRLHLKVVLVIY